MFLEAADEDPVFDEVGSDAEGFETVGPETADPVPDAEETTFLCLTPALSME